MSRNEIYIEQDDVTPLKVKDPTSVLYEEERKQRSTNPSNTPILSTNADNYTEQNVLGLAFKARVAVLASHSINHPDDQCPIYMSPTPKPTWDK